ncbi:MAG: 23S rRNA (adenine(2503)-C(2))-methyltransferase RlmN [Nitrospirota bacterium]
MISGKTNLKSLSKKEIFQFIENIGLPPYRANQLIYWIYNKYATEINEITEFSKDLRKLLNEIAFISNLAPLKRLKSSDGTEKFLFSLEDGDTIESVLIPNTKHLTLCISSQVGCSMGCCFCLTAKCGLVRSLKSHEIVDQIIAVNRMISPKKITNVVLMGMGEPLANFSAVIDALWRITEFIGISKRKITLSTAGIVPKILLLPQKAPEINLAISLNATTDETRNKIMPINKRYPIKSIIDACKGYPLKIGRRITFEYVLINGINDSKDDAYRLINLLKGLRCKVNLIPLNPHSGSEFERPPEKKVMEFQKILNDNNVRAFIRESKGQDILGACGQLRAGYSPERGVR